MPLRSGVQHSRPSRPPTWSKVTFKSTPRGSASALAVCHSCQRQCFRPVAEADSPASGSYLPTEPAATVAVVAPAAAAAAGSFPLEDPPFASSIPAAASRRRSRTKPGTSSSCRKPMCQGHRLTTHPKSELTLSLSGRLPIPAVGSTAPIPRPMLNKNPLFCSAARLPYELPPIRDDAPPTPRLARGRSSIKGGKAYEIPVLRARSVRATGASVSSSDAAADRPPFRRPPAAVAPLVGRRLFSGESTPDDSS